MAKAIQSGALNLVTEYARIKRKYDVVKKQLDRSKKDLDKAFDVYFEKNKIEGNKVEFKVTEGIYYNITGKDLDKNLLDEVISIKEPYVRLTKVQPTKIVFYPEKVHKKLKEMKLSKDLVNKAIKKEFVLKNSYGLLQYLKTILAEDEFENIKEYFDIEKTVDEDELNQLEDLGVISIEDLEGCYDVIEKTRYYKINAYVK